MQPEEIIALQSQIALSDEKAYRKLFDCLYPRLKRFVVSVVQDEMSAEEIVEDIFVNIWRNRESITEIKNLPVYLYASARKRSLTYLTARSKDPLANPEQYPDHVVSQDMNPELLLMTREMAARIDHAILQLPPKCRLVFTLVREHQLKYREVAEILNLSEHTVDAHMTNAIHRIATTIKGHLTRRPKKK